MSHLEDEQGSLGDILEVASDFALEGRFDRSLGCIDLLENLGHRSTAVHLYRAILLAMIGRSAEATQAIEQVRAHVRNDVEMARLKAAKGYLKFREDEIEEGAELIEQAVRLDPDLHLVRFSLGRHLLFIVGDHDKAGQHLLHVSKKNPNSTSAQLGMVSLAVEMGDFSKAASASLSALKALRFSLKPVMPWVLSVLMASPLSGRLPLVASVIAMLFPMAGQVAILVWLLFSILSYTLLRRISPRFFIYSAINLIGSLAAFSARWILTGRIWP